MHRRAVGRVGDGARTHTTTGPAVATPTGCGSLRIVGRYLRLDDLVGEDAYPLDFRLDPVAGLEEVAGGGADPLGRSGGDDIRGQQRHALGQTSMHWATGKII